MKDHPLGGPHSEKDSQKSRSPRAALVPPCPSWQYIRQIVCQGTSHGTGSAPGEKTPTRLEICTQRFSFCGPSSLKLCSLSLWLPAFHAAVLLEVCGELLSASLIHSPQNQIGFGSDPIQDLYCISAHRNIKEQSLVICSIISSIVP